MKTAFVAAFLLSVALSGCRTLPTPITVAPSAFDEAPIIIQRDDRYYVRYRLSPERMGVRSYPVVQKENDKAFIYFSMPVSYPEWGQLQEIPLRPHDAEEFVKSGRFYLRDANGNDHKLEIRNEK
jgi:hypothetical protein